MKTLIAVLFILTAGLAILYTQTDGFNALTAEDARRYAAIHKSNLVERVRLTTHTGQDNDYFGASNQIVIVDFVFTYCPTVCQSLGRSFYRLQEELRQRGLSEQVQLVSISFDLETDHVPELEAFAKRHKADPNIWRVARPQTEEDLERLLHTFGVVVIEDPLFRFVHNAGLHFVSPEGKLIAILDANDVTGGVALIEASI